MRTPLRTLTALAVAAKALAAELAVTIAGRTIAAGSESALLATALAALAAAFELPALAWTASVLGLVALLEPKWALPAVAGAAVVAAVALGTNRVAHGSFLPPYAHRAAAPARDATGAAISAARVVLRDLATGQETTVETNAQGRYTITTKTTGTFLLIVQHDGFAELARTIVTVTESARPPLLRRVGSALRRSGQAAVGVLMVVALVATCSAGSRLRRVSDRGAAPGVVAIPSSRAGIHAAAGVLPASEDPLDRGVQFLRTRRIGRLTRARVLPPPSRGSAGCRIAYRWSARLRACSGSTTPRPPTSAPRASPSPG